MNEGKKNYLWNPKVLVKPRVKIFAIHLSPQCKSGKKLLNSYRDNLLACLNSQLLTFLPRRHRVYTFIWKKPNQDFK